MAKSRREEGAPKGRAAGASAGHASAESVARSFKYTDARPHIPLFEVFATAGLTAEEQKKIVSQAIINGGDPSASILTINNFSSAYTEHTKGTDLATTFVSARKLKTEAEDALKGSTVRLKKYSKTKAVKTKLIENHDMLKVISESAVTTMKTVDNTLNIVECIMRGYTPWHVAAMLNRVDLLEAMYTTAVSLDMEVSLELKCISEVIRLEEIKAAAEANKMADPTANPYIKTLAALIRGTHDEIDPKHIWSPMRLAAGAPAPEAVFWLITHGAHFTEDDAEALTIAINFVNPKGGNEELQGILAGWFFTITKLKGEHREKLEKGAVKTLPRGSKIADSEYDTYEKTCKLQAKLLHEAIMNLNKTMRYEHVVHPRTEDHDSATSMVEVARASSAAVATGTASVVSAASAAIPAASASPVAPTASVISMVEVSPASPAAVAMAASAATPLVVTVRAGAGDGDIPISLTMSGSESSDISTVLGNVSGADIVGSGDGNG